MTDEQAVVMPFELPAERAERERQEHAKNWLALIRAELREMRTGSKSTR